MVMVLLAHHGVLAGCRRKSHRMRDMAILLMLSTILLLLNWLLNHGVVVMVACAVVAKSRVAHRTAAVRPYHMMGWWHTLLETTGRWSGGATAKLDRSRLLMVMHVILLHKFLLFATALDILLVALKLILVAPNDVKNVLLLVLGVAKCSTSLIFKLLLEPVDAVADYVTFATLRLQAINCAKEESEGA